MRTPANIAKHPIHPMLVPLPIGLWIFSLVCDLISLAGYPGAWSTVAFYTMVGGIVGALAAAIPGFIDLLSLPPGPRGTALAHMTINLTVVGLYVINSWLRWPDAANFRGAPLWLSLIGVGLLAISGWLGGKMVYVDGIAVDAAPDRTTPGRR
jgi:uncharacterized membrane protein